MSRSRGVVIAVAGGVIAGILYLTFRGGDRPDDRAAAAPTVRAPAPASDVAELRVELAQLRRQVRSQDAIQRAPVAPADPKDARRDPEAAAEAERRHDAYLAGLDGSFHDEALDHAWSTTAAGAIHDALASDGQLGPLARSVECRSQSCRVELADDGTGTLSKSVPMLALRVGQELPSMVARRVDGADGRTMVLYLRRE
jgi:hypothetical protein